ncbi:MAG: 4'-phosphopantetheinyl transferase [Gemmobacter sp.]
MPDLCAALRGLLPPGAGVAQTDPCADHPLWPGEHLPGATPARLREFAAGRAAFRAALADAGLPPMALPITADRSPAWPSGLALSITHTAGTCLAAVLPGARGLGIDLEPDEDLPSDLIPLILTAQEPADPRTARLIFSAKEAAYKAIYPLTRRVIGFDAMRVIPGDTLIATLLATCPPFSAGHVLTGRSHQGGGSILTAFAVS